MRFEANKAVDEGGAVKLVKTETSFLDASFVENVVEVGDGAATAIDSASVGFARARFVRNVATSGNGGAVSSAGSAAIEFFPTSSTMQAAMVACAETSVDVVTDWSATSATCSPISYGSTGNTCDYWPQGCADIIGSVGVAYTVEGGCAGCACYGGFGSTGGTEERYYELRSNATTVRGSPRSGAVKVDSFCLAGGRYEIQAIDTLGDGWFGGQVRIFVKDARGAILEEIQGPTPFDGWASTVVEFTVPTSSLASIADSNGAPRGGGGLVYWTDVEPAGEILVVGANSARYGQLLCDARRPPRAVDGDHSHGRQRRDDLRAVDIRASR